MTITDTMRDPQLFGRWFAAPSWDAWRLFLAALFALPMTEAQREVYTRHTGRQHAPTRPARECYVPAGRRAGKDRIAALIAVYLACFRRYALAPGEKGVIMLLAADRKQARVAFRYIAALLDETPMLAALVTRRTLDTIELSTGLVIEIHTASYKTTRGYTIVAFIGSEIAFWPTDQAANPDAEILQAVRPALATVPGSLLLAVSSPYARRGVLWEQYRAHYGQDGDPVLVWQSDSASMNPTIDPEVIADAYAVDPVAARAEFGGEFRADIETFVSLEAVEAAVVPDQRERAPRPEYSYVAFVDPSGGSADSMTLAISHAEEEADGRIVLVLDAVREAEPPFSPEQVVADFAETLRAYRLTRVVGDRYGGEWPRERFRQYGIAYDVASRTKNDLYRDILPHLNSQAVEVLDVPRLHAQLLGLERRAGHGGRDVIDHAPGAHDDVINAVVGSLLEASVRARRG